jgi:hypothetical protein
MTAKITKYPMQEDTQPIESAPKSSWFLPQDMSLSLQFNEISEGIFVLVVHFNPKSIGNEFTAVTYHQVRSSLKTNNQDLSLFKSAVLAYESFIGFFDIEPNISIFDTNHSEIAAFELSDENEPDDVEEADDVEEIEEIDMQPEPEFQPPQEISMNMPVNA